MDTPFIWSFDHGTVDSRYLDLAYLEVKIWSLPKNENLTIGKNIVEKRRNFSSFPQYFQYISNFRNQITYIFANYFFLNSENLICRGTDISKYFRESLGIRDNES